MAQHVTFAGATGFRQTLSAALLAVGMAATVGGALLFQHVGGYMPCALCLEQRTPYYIGIPVAIAALLSSKFRAPPLLTRALLVSVGLLMIWAAGLGIYHAGVEWGFWPGPTACTGVGDSFSFDQLDNMTPVIGCDVVQFRFLGISLAGYNALISLAIVVLLITAIVYQARRKA
jgi:disulfide bond formation protein DsbB